MNWRAVWIMYSHEMARAIRTIGQSLISPVITTVLYFIVFGSAVGAQIGMVDDVPYAAFIIPGLMMLTILTQAVSNASFGIFLPNFIGSIYELLSAPVSYLEITIGFVGAAATKSFVIGLVILATSTLFTELRVEYPVLMLLTLMLTCIVFALFGFVIGIWAKNFEQLQVVPLLIITPLVFLGGSFYSISVLPPFWQTVSLFNPVVYLIDLFRWTFYGEAEVYVLLSLTMVTLFAALCLAVLAWMFRTGYRLRN